MLIILQLGDHAPTITFLQFLQAGDLLSSIQCVDTSHALGEADIVGEGSCELHEQSIERSEAFRGHGIGKPLEVAVPIAVEAHLLGLPLGAERLQCTGAVEAAVGTMRRAGDQTVPPGPRSRAAALPSPSSPGLPLLVLPLVEMLQLDAPCAGHCDVSLGGPLCDMQ